MKLLLMLFTLISCQSDRTPQYVFSAPDASENIIRFPDKVVTSSELFNDITPQIFQVQEELFKIKMEQTETYLLKYFVENDPSRGDLSQQDFISQKILSTIKITPKEVDQFIQENAPGRSITEKDRAQVEQYLKKSKEQEVLRNWVMNKAKNAKVEILLAKPSRPKREIPVAPEDARLGTEKAKIQIVEFSDFQCAFCAKGAKILKQLKAKYGDKLSIVHKHFPLPRHLESKNASIASLCAREQKPDTYWVFHEEFFSNQASLGESFYLELAKKKKLDEAKFSDCLKSGKFNQLIERNVQEGQTNWVDSTPTYFINGEWVGGALPLAEFESIINRLL